MGKQLSRFINKELSLNDISMREFARRADLSVTAVARLINEPDRQRASGEVRIPTLFALADLTGVSLAGRAH